MKSSFTTCLLVSEEDETVIEVYIYCILLFISCIKLVCSTFVPLGWDRKTREIHCLLWSIRWIFQHWLSCFHRLNFFHFQVFLNFRLNCIEYHSWSNNKNVEIIPLALKLSLNSLNIELCYDIYFFNGIKYSIMKFY